MGRPPTPVRISQPSWLNTQTLNGFGFVPRKIDNSDQSLLSIDAILSMAQTQPLRVLQMLPDMVPEVSKATWNDIRLACGTGSVRMKAMTVGAAKKEAPEGTAEIDALWLKQPQELGGFNGILAKNFLMAQYSGMTAVEAVPGGRDAGIGQVWPIETLSLRFKRDPATRQVQLWQRVRAPMVAQAAYRSGYIKLPPERTFWSSMDGFPDDPYGRAPLMAALVPVLEMVAFMKDLLLAWHRVGCPKWDVGFDYEMHAKIAKESLGLTTSTEIIEYVEQEFNKQVTLFENLNADDAFFHDIKTKIDAKGSGGAWPNVDQIYNIIRWRIIIALKQMPTLMGVVEGSTETWSSVDWQIYSKGLASLVEIAARPLISAAQLHLQLLGMPYIVEAEYEPVRANQRMVDAQSEQIEIDNELKKVFAGWINNEQASMVITGSAPNGVMDKEALGVMKPEPANATGEGTKGKVGTKGPTKGN